MSILSPPIFAVVPGSTVVVQGSKFIASASSNNMAKRIANALNQYTPDRRGQ